MSIRATALLCLVLAPFPALAADTAAVRQCRIYVQARIDMVDAEMRKGHDTTRGKKLLAQRDRLRTHYKACDSNPKAYKKAL